ncbi:uncharacterized protein [Asterias amurensis]|uniref:uncharacterized protein n=1 Tax=Asterias amurensis TaxID=7602 RepID=UPI003AB61548
MATRRDNGQSQLVPVLPGYPACPATTQSLPSDTVLQNLLESNKINSLQTTETATTSHSDTQMIYTGYHPVAKYQATLDRPTANEGMTLHPGLTNELRALQVECGFETTSDFLHHLVVSERVKRLQKLNSSARQSSSAESSIPDLMQAANQCSYPSSTNTVMSSNNSWSACRLENSLGDRPLVEGASPEGQAKPNHGGQTSGVELAHYAVKSERVSVGVQVNLCQCRLEDESDCTNRKKSRKLKGGIVSKVKKNGTCSQRGDRDDVKVRLALRERRWSIKTKGVRQPKQRFSCDTKSAPRAKQEYLCEICGATFKCRRSLIPHMWEHRGKASIHKCPHCNVSFPYACRLKRHLIAKHPELEGGPIRCATCGVEVQSYTTLKSHMRIHTGYKPFKCTFCPKAYKWKTGVEYHERSHTGERPFPCQRCTKAFTNKSDLNRHQTVHTGEKPYVCQNCGKGFTQRHTLKSHCKKHHPASLSKGNFRLTVASKQHHPKVNTISQAMHSSEEAAFIMGSFHDPAPANLSLEQMKFTNNGAQQSLQRREPTTPTEREIAEVVVNMLAQ